MNRSGRRIVAIDLPSGLDSDSGQILGCAIQASLTVTLGRPKRGLCFGGGTKIAGAFGVAAGKCAVATGPGIGREPETVGLVLELLTEIKHPLVLDADGINALAGHAQILRRAQAPVILTPHPGEMARLLGTSVADVQNNRLGVAGRFARDFNVHLILKGAGTVLAGPDGLLA